MVPADINPLVGPPGIHMPAVLARDLSSLNLDADQQQAIETLADEFVAKVGGADPNLSELYRRQVRTAISEADARYRLLYGDRAYVQLQLLASRQLAQ